MYRECCAASGDSAVCTVFGHMRAAKHRVETFATPLSRTILGLTGYLAFAVKLSIVRKGEREARVALAFLNSLTVVLLLVAAMMADGAVVVMILIRMFDTEDVSTPDMCTAVEDLLDRLTWLFYKGGCFAVPGHVSFVLQWLREPHFYTIDGVGKCIGGSPVTDAQKTESLQHLQTWCVLVRSCLSAEFPSFSLICAFQAFALSKNCPVVSLSHVQREKLQRLSQCFKKPNLINEFEVHVSYANAAWAASDYKLSYWDAWFVAVAKVARMSAHGGTHPSGDLRFVLKRGKCFKPVTSGVEQSFAKVAQRLPPQRLNAGSSTEARAVGLLLCVVTGPRLDALALAAQTIWRVAFPDRHSRLHVAKRVDADLPRPLQRSVAEPASSSTSLPTERGFLKRLRAQVVGSSVHGTAAVLDSVAPSIWDASHARELVFQDNKRHKRLVEAFRSV